MEAVLFQIVRALATVFEITLAFALLNAMFEPKYASKWPLRLSYLLLLAAVFSSSARLTVISVKTAVEILLVFLVSLLVIRALVSYVRRHSFSAFGVYRIVLGALVVLYFLTV